MSTTNGLRAGRLGARGLARGAAIRAAVGLCLVVAASGCAGLGAGPVTPQGKAMQVAITGMIVVDTLQTRNFAKARDVDGQPCVREANPLAFGGDAHPSEGKILAHNLLYGLGHWLLGGWLDRKASTSRMQLRPDGGWDVEESRWAGAQKWYWRLTMGGHGLTIASNARQGFHPIGKAGCGM